MNVRPMFAQGGIITRKEARVIGDDTPELLMLPKGSLVVPITPVQKVLQDTEGKKKQGSANTNTDIWSRLLLLGSL